MKKTIFKTLWALLVVATIAPLASCSSDDDEGVKSFKVNVTIGLPEGVAADNVEGLQLIATKGTVSDTVNIANPAATEITLPQGQYTFTVTGKVKDEATAYLTGKASADIYSEKAVTVALSKVTKSSLIFKSLFTTGGYQYYMLDSYFEIVNNSDEVQYLDGVIISAPQGNQSEANAWQANGVTDLYASGQGAVLAFPGTGKDYPLEPGKSVLIANNATNHKEAAPEGNICPDLSNADWEVYLDNVNGEIDYPAPNLKVIYTNNTYMKAFGLGISGRGYILAKLPEGTTPEAYAADSTNIQIEPNTTGYMQYLMIPSKYVLDAVDIWNGKDDTHYGTFLPKDDAQGVFASESWSGKCIRRKVTEIKNGRPYYQDTNNSAADFLNNQECTPGVTPTQVDK